MNTEVARLIVDMATLALTSPTFSTTYTFANGKGLVVSKNSLAGRGACSLATLPLDESGAEEWDRAEEWQTARDVAERMAFIASE